MKLRLIFVGKTRNPHLRALLDDYRKRIARFAPIEISEWRETAAGPGTIAAARGKRAPALPVVLLDAAGHAFSSEEFSRWLAAQERRGVQALVFLLGGAEGFPEATKQQADFLLSLSKLTLPHELARLLLLEQLYRALTRLRRHPYPK